MIATRTLASARWVAHLIKPVTVSALDRAIAEVLLREAGGN